MAGGYSFDVTHWQALAASIDDPFPIDHRCSSEEAEQLRAGHALSARGTTASQRAGVMRLLRQLRVPLVVLDEAQHMAQLPGGRSQVQQLDVIKDSVDRSGAHHLLVGTYDLRLMVFPNGQHARRSRVVHFASYDFGKEADRRAFREIFGQLVIALPFDEPRAILDALGQRVSDVYVGCAGCVGILKDWLLLALQQALVAGRSAIAWEDLEATRLSDLALYSVASEVSAYRQMEARSYRGEIDAALGLSNPAPARTSAVSRSKTRTKPGKRAPARDPVGLSSNDSS